MTVTSHLHSKKMSCLWAIPSFLPAHPLSSMRLHQVSCGQDRDSSRTEPTRGLVLTFLAASDSRSIWTTMSMSMSISMDTKFQSRLRKKHARDSTPLVRRWDRSYMKSWKSPWRRLWLQQAQQQLSDHLSQHPERQRQARARVCLHSDWPRLRAKRHPAQRLLVAAAIFPHQRHTFH